MSKMATFESERAALVAEVGECCWGNDPLCAAGCLIEKALRKNHARWGEFMGELKAALQELPEHTDGQSARVGSSQHPAVAAPLGAPKMSPKHEHEPEIPPLLAKDGSCWICKLMCRIDDAADELAYVKGELAEANSAAERWYIAACPYGTPNALREALDLTKP